MKKRKIALVLAALITLSAPLSFGASIKRNLEAYFSGIKIFVDGKQLMISQKDEPFIYNQTTYVPLRVVTENFGYKVGWNGTTQTISLTANTDPSSPNVSSLRYQLSTKDAEINTLKFKIQELENQVAMLKKGDYSGSNYTGSISSGNILIKDGLNTEKGMKSYLEKEYEDYTEGHEEFSFDFDVDDRSRFVEIEMQSDDFKKGDSDWKKRKDRDFEKYIEDIAEKVADEFDKDVKIIVKDRNEKTTVEFDYDESKDKLSADYGDEIMLVLEDKYDEFTDNNPKDDLEFEFDIDNDSSSYLRINMKGKNFDKDDSDWKNVKDNKKSDFEDFIKDMCKDVLDELEDMDDEKDIKVYVKDDDNDYVFDCRFDEGDKTLTSKSWYN